MTWNLDFSATADKLEAMARAVMAQLPNLVLSLLALVLFWMFSRWVGSGVAQLLQRGRRQPPAPQVIGRLARWTVMLVGILVALTILVPSMSVASIFGALGVGGVAIGFAFKDIFQNLLAGLLLLVTRPFHLGDTVVTGAIEGVVEDIQIRATRVRLADGRVAVVPNSELFTGRVVVQRPGMRRRGVLDLGVSYDTDLQRAREVIVATAARVPGVLNEPAPSVLARTFGESTIDLQLRYWVGPPQPRALLEVTDELIHALKRALDEAGISLAFPTRTLMVQTPPSEPAAEARAVPGPEAPGERRPLAPHADAALLHGGGRP